MLNTVRHIELFDNNNFNKSITIIGAGATGSFLALSLAKLGIKDITVFDYDVVEEHNIPNQLFGIRDVGKPKVEALKRLIRANTGLTIDARNEKYIDQQLGDYVFLMVDSMKERYRIFEDNIKFKSSVELMIDPRMGLSLTRMFCVEPSNIDHIKKYEDNEYSDDESETSACGASVSVISGSLITASLCVRAMIEFYNGQLEYNEFDFDTKFLNILNYKW